tara:strand:+ start:1416 stop:1868 length:453 start_codon:yes stop_codon:yes gene_type:complete
MTTIVGVDPGSQGGVAFYNEQDGIYMASDLMPVTDFIDDLDGIEDDVIFVVEDVPPFTGKIIPGSSAFKMGKSYGLILGLALGRGYSTYAVKPKKWQKDYDGLGSSKGNERKKRLKDICKQLHPKLKVTYKTCDAILLLHYFLTNEHAIK